METDFLSPSRRKRKGRGERGENRGKMEIKNGAGEILKQLGMDVESMDIAALEQGLKKIEGISTIHKTKREAQNIRNMIIVLTDDIIVLIMKLAMELSALRALDEDGGEDERKAAARSCLDIYAPLAGRLGIALVKNEMEDLSLKFLYRDAFQQVKDLVAEKKEQRGLYLSLASEEIFREAEAAGIKIEIESRAKHFYSVYMKMRKRKKNSEEIYDLQGIRIICETTENCYALLGLVHRLWKPINNTFKDYIANPKPNGYKSLHTSVSTEAEGFESRGLEIQIRTGEMHSMAEHGVASHWLYKSAHSGEAMREADIEIAARHGAASDENWLEEIKEELYKRWVYVFTPQGKVIELPRGATALDFAYQVHTAIGDHCMGAKANGAIIPLSSELQNAQVVEILTRVNAHPNVNWLEMVRTSKARSKIRSWLSINDESFMQEKEDDKKTLDEDNQAIKIEADSEEPHSPVRSGESIFQVRINDEKNMMVRFARCCNPDMGDPITGYVSRGRGVIIHRTGCNNLMNNPEYEERKIKAAWEEPEPAGSQQTFTAKQQAAGINKILKKQY